MDIQFKQIIECLRNEYLRSFISQGGAAVKFLVSKQEYLAEQIQRELSVAAHEDGYVFVPVTAEMTQIHCIDKLFHAIACEIRWDEWAASFIRTIAIQQGCCVLPEQKEDLTLRWLAEKNERDENEFYNEMNRTVERAIFHDPVMCREFQTAMKRLCMAQLAMKDDAEKWFEHDRIIDWLQGRLQRISDLKHSNIYQKIVRHNARSMLYSLIQWLKLNGSHGLTLLLDISRYMIQKRPMESDGSRYYSKTAVMDLYEVLRQFIDGTDELSNCLIVVTAPVDFITSDRRGVTIYSALKLRIWDDVYDMHRPNPMAPLIRISDTAELHPYVTRHSDGSPLFLQQHRAIEALRSGTPNQDAVRELGCHQPHIEEQFHRMLRQMEQSPENPCHGMIVSGGFGSGKSHLLEYLQHIALNSRFACSTIVISKETPFYDPVKLYRAAIENIRIPDQNHRASITDILNRIDDESEEWNRFFEWINFENSGLNGCFGATFYIYSKKPRDPDMQSRIVRFWSGDPMNVQEIRRELRLLGESATYKIDRMTKSDLARMRFIFLAGLIRAANYSGWILLIDEAELIGRYSLLQRGRSYAMLAEWMKRTVKDSFPGIAAVVAITDDFGAAVLAEKDDLQKIPNRFRIRSSELDRKTGSDAEKGMKIIQEQCLSILEPLKDIIDITHVKIQSVYQNAYQWPASLESSLECLGTTRMREYIKAWITEWDLKRIDPDYQAAIETAPVSIRYDEDEDLEAASDETPGDGD